MAEDDKAEYGTAARVTRSDWGAIATEAGKKAKARRLEHNKRIDREGTFKEQSVKLYVMVSEDKRQGWVAEVVSGLSAVEQTMLGNRRLGAKGTSPEQAKRRLHMAYLEFLRREKIMRSDDARKRAATAQIVEMDRVKL